METKTVEDINNYIFDAYIKKGTSPQQYLKELVYKLYTNNRLDTIESLLNIYGPLQHAGIFHHAAKMSPFLFTKIFSMVGNEDNLSMRDNMGDTVAHHLCKHSNAHLYPVAKDAIEKLCNVKNNKGQTPLFISIQNKNTPIIRYIMSSAIIDKEDYDVDGNNILHYAYKSNDEEIIALIARRYPLLEGYVNCYNLHPSDYNIFYKWCISTDHTCCACKFEPHYKYTLPCGHIYCIDCLCDEKRQRLQCKYKCSIGDLTLKEIPVTPSTDLDRKTQAYYIRKFHAITKHVDSARVMGNTIFIPKEDREIVCKKVNNRVNVCRRVNIPPTHPYLRLKILLACLDENRVDKENKTSGCYYWDGGTNSLYAQYTFCLDYIRPGHIFTTTIDPETFSMKPRMSNSEILEMLPSYTKISPHQIKLPNDILMKVGKGSYYIEVETFITKIDTEHLLSVEYLLGYIPGTETGYIDNFRVGVDPATGVTKAYATLYVCTCSNGYIKEFIDNFTKETRILINRCQIMTSS